MRCIIFWQKHSPWLRHCISNSYNAFNQTDLKLYRMCYQLSWFQGLLIISDLSLTRFWQLCSPFSNSTYFQSRTAWSLLESDFEWSGRRHLCLNIRKRHVKALLGNHHVVSEKKKKKKKKIFPALRKIRTVAIPSWLHTY